MPTPYGDLTTTEKWLTPAPEEPVVEVEETEEEADDL